MPKRTDINSILILGAGPIIIGQACEFDYSGTQACQALKEEGYRVILVNSNPATIMTDPALADATYIEPVKWPIVEKIIQKERPDAILPTMGGQTALNCSLDLNRHGVLKKYDVELIGASCEAIDKAEDRELFDNAMTTIGLETPQHGMAHNMEQAYEALEKVGFPCIIRPSFTLGGTGGGIAYNREEFDDICARGLELSPTNELLIDESLIGWKEFEGIHNRTDYDLARHQEYSGKRLEYIDPASNERYIPYVVETSMGVDRTLLVLLADAYREEEVEGEKRVLLALKPKLAPLKAAVFPLVKKDGMPEIAMKLMGDLRSSGIPSFYDQSGAIGRRYRRQDEIGTPWCITVDGQSTEDGTVTVRDRDSLEQERVGGDQVVNWITDRLS
jgi:hypothetical protein